ncbi:MAG: cytochrome c [Anaerolineales bacterium]|nr:cytochrome c [Anaerolineales bacterium]
MKTKFFAAFLLIVLLLAACGGSEAGSGAGSGQVSEAAKKYAGLVGDPVKGKAHYESTCIACHGPEGVGVQGLGKGLATSEWVKSQSDADLILFLAEQGRPAGDPLNSTGIDMPVKGGNPALKTQDLADIVAYIRTLQK